MEPIFFRVSRSHLVIVTGLDLISCEPGAPGNEYSAEIVTGAGALTIAMVGNVLTITLAVGGSTKNAIATAINDAAADTYQKIRANVTAGGGTNLTTAVAEASFAGALVTDYGWSCSVGQADCPIKHDVGNPTSSAHVSETLATVVVPDLTALVPPRTNADVLPIDVVSSNILTRTLSSSGGSAAASALTGAVNPNGVVVGVFGQEYYDTVAGLWYICHSNPGGTAWDVE